MAVGPRMSFLIDSLALCVFPLASTAIAILALVCLPQGAEVLRTITDQALLHPFQLTDEFTLVLLFLSGLALWATANWYAARLLLQRDFAPPPAPVAGPAVGPAAVPAAPIDDMALWRFKGTWREWSPRALILVGGFPIAGALAGHGQLWTGAAAALIALGLFVLAVARRRVLGFIARHLRLLPTVIVAGSGLIAGALLAYNQVWMLVAAVLVALGLFALVLVHRHVIDWFGASSRWPVLPNAKGQRPDLPEGEELALWLAGPLSIVVFAALTCVNYGFARWLGGASILLLALATIALYGSLFLIYLPKVAGWPPLTGLAIVIAIVLGSLGATANHGIAARRVDADAQTRVYRPLAAEHFSRWHDAQTATDACREAPIILVAAEGGASRSAWWTAHVLGVLDDLTNGCFGDRVFAASGISGGSLGVATWVALRRDQRDRQPSASRPDEAPTHPDQADCEGHNLAETPIAVKSACFLGRDFVSPVLGYMLGADLAQRFFPVPRSDWDRSRGLEDTWRRDWSALFRTNAFGQPLIELYQFAPPPPPAESRDGGLQSPLRVDLPILLLNTATVDRGRPAVQSPVRMWDPEIDDLLDPVLRTAGLTLAGAVHNSARFPYVSPGGDIVTTDGKHFDTVVDGGYIENSGALGLAALMRAIKSDRLAYPACKPDREKCIAWKQVQARLVVLFIANDPYEPLPSAFELCNSNAQPLDTHARTRWGEAATPPIGLFKARSSRADTARRALLRELGLCEGTEPGARAFFVSMASPMVREVSPVMSWYMTPQVRQTMWRAVATEPARSEVLRLVVKHFAVDRERASERLRAFGVVKPSEIDK